MFIKLWFCGIMHQTKISSILLLLHYLVLLLMHTTWNKWKNFVIFDMDFYDRTCATSMKRITIGHNLIVLFECLVHIFCIVIHVKSYEWRKTILQKEVVKLKKIQVRLWDLSVMQNFIEISKKKGKTLFLAFGSK